MQKEFKLIYSEIADMVQLAYNTGKNNIVNIKMLK